MTIKSHVLKALFAHTGAILSNKIGHHRPTKLQQSRLRDMAHSSILLGGSWADREARRAESEVSSSRELSIMEEDDEDGYRSPPYHRTSFASGRSGTASESRERSTPGSPQSSSMQNTIETNGSTRHKDRDGSSTPGNRPRTASSSIASGLARSFSLRRPNSSKDSTPFHTPPPLSKEEVERVKAMRRLTGSHTSTGGGTVHPASSQQEMPGYAGEETTAKERRRSKLPRFLQALKPEKGEASSTPSS